MFALLAPFSEGLRATIEPCSFLLVAPITTALVATGARWQSLVAALSSGVVGGWMLVDNRWILDGWLLQISAVAVAGLLLVTAIPALGDRITFVRFDAAATQATVVALATLAATLWWRPCVGVELGQILNDAQNGIGRQLVPMAAYMLGILFVVPSIVALRYAVRPSERSLTVGSRVFAGIGLVIAAALAAGQHDEVVVTLTRWTLE